METIFVVVAWPESQQLMEQDWFDECTLINNGKALEEFGSSAYLVPDERARELT